jgi:hypothetical protein
MLLLPFVCFLILLMIIYGKNDPQSFLLNSIKSVILISVYSWFNIEILSLFKGLNYFNISFSWILFTSILILYLLKNKNIVSRFNIRILTVFQVWTLLSIVQKTTSVLCFSFIGVLFAQGLAFAPNNWDSQTYHLARIIHWFNHGDLSFFPTHIVRQLYQPPFGEYLIMHSMALTKGDAFAFSIQWCYYIFSVLGVMQITSYFIKDRFIILFSGIIALFIPEAVLQATSTQNDIVNSFFILASIVFFAETILKPTTTNFIYIGLTIGLAFLTKALAYIYIPVIGVLFIVLYLKQNHKKTTLKNYIRYISITLGLIFILNFNHSFNNYKLSNNIFGTNKQESKDYALENKSPISILSNMTKNIGLHADPIFIRNTGNRILEKLHLVMHYDLNKPGNNYKGMQFSCNPGLKNHEDCQPNFIHFLSIIFTILILTFSFLKNRKNNQTNIQFYYSMTITLCFILFCILFKWQPWNTRIQLPLFFLFSPMIAIGLGQLKFKKGISSLLIFILFVNCAYITIYNFNKPIIHSKQTSKISCKDNVYKQYFANSLNYFQDYDNITKIIAPKKIDTIGLIMHSDTWEYPLFRNYFINPKTILHLSVNNYSKKLKTSKQITPNYIINNIENKDTIHYKLNIFYNLTSKNGTIWIYKLDVKDK